MTSSDAADKRDIALQQELDTRLGEILEVKGKEDRLRKLKLFDEELNAKREKIIKRDKFFHNAMLWAVFVAVTAAFVGLCVYAAAFGIGAAGSVAAAGIGPWITGTICGLPVGFVTAGCVDACLYPYPRVRPEPAGVRTLANKRHAVWSHICDAMADTTNLALKTSPYQQLASAFPDLGCFFKRVADRRAAGAKGEEHALSKYQLQSYVPLRD